MSLRSRAPYTLDFDKLASALANSKPPTSISHWVTREATEVWKAAVFNIADVLEANRPKFDRTRFLVASGVERIR